MFKIGLIFMKRLMRRLSLRDKEFKRYEYYTDVSFVVVDLTAVNFYDAALIRTDFRSACLTGDNKWLQVENLHDGE